MNQKDTNSQATELIRAVTGAKKTRGEDLLGDPRLQKSVQGRQEGGCREED
jgi:hypothetical protein